MLYFQVNSEGTRVHIHVSILPQTPLSRSCVGCRMAWAPLTSLESFYWIYSVLYCRGHVEGLALVSLFRLFLMRRDLSSVPAFLRMSFFSGRCLVFSSATVFSTLAMVFLGVCLCLSYLRFVELLGSTGFMFSARLGRFGPLFPGMVSTLLSHRSFWAPDVVLWNTNTLFIPPPPQFIYLRFQFR